MLTRTLTEAAEKNGARVLLDLPPVTIMQTTRSASNESSTARTVIVARLWTSKEPPGRTSPYTERREVKVSLSGCYRIFLLMCSVHETALPPKGRLDHAILADIYTRSGIHLDDSTTVAARVPNGYNVSVLATRDMMATDHLSCKHLAPLPREPRRK